MLITKLQKDKVDGELTATGKLQLFRMRLSGDLLAGFLDKAQGCHYLRDSWHSPRSSANSNRETGTSFRSKRVFIMAKTKFRPLHDRVVVRRVESEAKTAGGIIIPDTAKEKPQEGEVIAVGPGARDEAGKLVALDVKAGDRVLFGKWSGTEVKLNGEDLLIMKESDIMGILG